MYDVTNSAVVQVGACVYNGTAHWGNTVSTGMAAITITASTQFKLQYGCETAVSTHGLGYRSNLEAATPSVYSQVKIRKLK